MRIAIVGSGISGLTVAAGLHAEHDITVYESGAHVGGHARTVRVTMGEQSFDADVGFMVFNTTTYPQFTAMLERLGIASRETSMGFSVRCDRTGVEWCGTSLDGVFAQRRNLLRPAFLRMLADVVRFNREARALADGLEGDVPLGAWIAARGYSEAFRDLYLVPMGAAIWSASERSMLAFPARFFARFFRNHGLLDPPGRQLAWRTIVGGSQRYIEALAAPFRERIRTRTPVRAVRRRDGSAWVSTDAGAERFDAIVLACHADQALTLLGDASPLERSVLAAFPYQPNRGVLHTDTAVLPTRRRAWSSWNYHVPAESTRAVSITYDLSRLQGLATPTPLLLTLNDGGAIARAKVIADIPFEHPLFTTASRVAQARHAEISGVAGVHFCGAYWRHGFHEDGQWSGWRVVEAIRSRAGSMVRSFA